MTFIPATVIGTPIGNFLQEHLPSDILRTVVGVVITLLISYQLTKLVPNSGLYKKWMEKKEEKKGSGGVAVAADDMQQVDAEEKVDGHKNEEEIVSDKGADDQMDSKETPEKEENDKKDEENQLNKDDGKNEVTNDVSPDLLTLVGNDKDVKVVTTTTDANATSNELIDNDEKNRGVAKDQVSKDEDEGNIPTGRKLQIWGFTLGFLSGFLGGLMGVR